MIFKSRFDKYLVKDLFFADSLHGWAVGIDTTNSEFGGRGGGIIRGGHGVILYTQNSGATWEVQIDDLSAPLTSIYIRDNRCWAVGENGLVLKKDNWVSRVGQAKIKKYSLNYSLSQNYPNPFNPVTMINYQLPMTSEVELSIYKLLGQKIATLLNERQQAGRHQIEWDASSLSSGVYYYRIEAENFVETRKMIYLK